MGGKGIGNVGPVAVSVSVDLILVTPYDRKLAEELDDPALEVTDRSAREITHS